MPVIMKTMTEGLNRTAKIQIIVVGYIMLQLLIMMV